MSRGSPAPDLVRSIYLLWGHHPAPGRSGLSVSRIVRAGIEVADAGGLDALSMRNVANHLEAGTMSLYAHVPGKDDLIALMVDAVLAEVYDDDVEAATRRGNWRAGMTYVAERNWDLYARHPWLLDLRPTTPLLGPHASRKYETELRPLDGIGLTDLAIDSALSLILSHVETTARAGRRSEDADMTDAAWWNIVSPALDQVMTDTDLQVSARIGAAVGTEYQATTADPTHTLRSGIDTILDGIQVAIERG